MLDRQLQIYTILNSQFSPNQPHSMHFNQMFELLSPFPIASIWLNHNLSFFLFAKEHFTYVDISAVLDDVNQLVICASGHLCFL